MMKLIEKDLPLPAVFASAQRSHQIHCQRQIGTARDAVVGYDERIGQENHASFAKLKIRQHCAVFVAQVNDRRIQKRLCFLRLTFGVFSRSRR